MFIWAINANKEQKEKVQQIKGNSVEKLLLKGMYEGGLSKVTTRIPISLSLNDDRLEIISHLNIVEQESLYLEYKDIISIDNKLVTERDVHGDVSLGKLFMFGLFAFGMKKKHKVSSVKLFLIKYKDVFGEIKTITISEHSMMIKTEKLPEPILDLFEKKRCESLFVEEFTKKVLENRN